MKLNGQNNNLLVILVTSFPTRASAVRQIKSVCGERHRVLFGEIFTRTKLLIMDGLTNDLMGKQFGTQEPL